MNDSLHIKDHLSIIRGKAFSNEERMKIAGKVTVSINGKTVHRSNRISSTLVNYLAQCIQFPQAGFIRPDTLFDDDEVPLGGTQDSRDGIVYRLTNGLYYTMITTEITPTETYGRRWRGESLITGTSPSPSPSGSPSPSPSGRYIDRIELGRDFNEDANDSAFIYLYAWRDQEVEDDVDPIDQLLFPYEISEGDTVVVEWETYFVDPNASPSP